MKDKRVQERQAITDQFDMMPETIRPALCYYARRIITPALYAQYVEQVELSIKEFGHFRILINYDHFPGWDAGAAEDDVNFYVTYGKYMKKMALVNAGEKEVMAKLVRKPLIGGELKIFSAAHFDEELEWIRK